MILTDNETKVDLLNNEAIAKTITKLLRGRPDHPVTIGVHGDWGAGKSSILEMIEAGLEAEKAVLCLKFNGWRFQGFEDAKIALIEGIVTGLVEKRPLLTKAGEAVKNVFRRIDWLKVAKKAGGLALTAFTGIPTPDQIHGIVGMLEGWLADPTKLATAANIKTAIEGVGGLLKPGDENKNVPEEIREFRKAFDELLKKAGVEQLVVLIDDLDRCLPDTAIETLEAVRLFVFTARTAFVVAADEAMIEYAVRKHFPELPDTTGPRDYARNYLEKLIQIPFRIPALGETETRIYVTLLLIGAAIGESEPEFNNLVAKAREQLKRPWASGALDAGAVQTALGTHADKAGPALNLSDQIGPILAAGTRGNPRQIKRFLNSLQLRHQIAEARGFGDEVKLPILAKLMLAERFVSRLFDHIASTAAVSVDGHCSDLAALEAAAAPPAQTSSSAPKTASTATATKNSAGTTDPAKVETAKTANDTAVLTEWLASPQIMGWARVQPPLAEIDLRPYLFVAKDRKDFFGASALGHLAGVVDRLLGSKMSVQGMEPTLKALVPIEAGQVFEAVCARIIGGDAFDAQPDGVAGLIVLVKAHPALQMSLVDFLGRLPRDRVGPWVVSGWTGVITDASATTRFEELLTLWSTSKNAMLKSAVGVLKTKKVSH
ncbi:MAG TPA: Qat anti-phage system ATPase QatA [Polyangia bacterium]|nr:Qat anti-phage system ATPase QatA [Polyangia bacterium]